MLRAEFPEFIGSSDVPYVDYRVDIAFDKIGPEDEEVLADLPKTRLTSQ